MKVLSLQLAPCAVIAPGVVETFQGRPYTDSCELGPEELDYASREPGRIGFALYGRLPDGTVRHLSDHPTVDACVDAFLLHGGSPGAAKEAADLLYHWLRVELPVAINSKQ